MTPDDPRHGTESGVWVHRAQKIPYCDACREFRARYERGRLNDVIMGRPRLISAVGSVRRLRALQRLGWPMEEIARRGGWKNRDSLLWMLRRSQLITRANAERIDDVYRELCMTIGPSEITRRRAERAGHLPPLAWDDIDNDPAPAEGESYEADPVVVMRLLEGRSVKANRAEREEAIRRWVEDGGAKTELCNIHGWEPGRYMVQTRLTLVHGGAA